MNHDAYDQPQTLADRIVWAVCGLFVGLPFALLAFPIAMAFGFAADSLGYVVAFVCAAFAIVGCFFGQVLFSALLALVHFLWGFIASQTGGPEPERGTAYWLKVLFWVGALLGAVVYITVWVF